ncbi:MAG: beta-lactamase family protein [Deltaproteobacteria bacterium]|nr:beta-lactamase family protein [Deltaproteobacteria bacterium]
MHLPFVTACRVPADLESVTAINTEAEVAPRELGAKALDVARVWRAVEQLYRSGIHPAIQLCVRRHGEVLIDRAIGHAAGNGPDDPPEAKKLLATPATPFNVFSASKAVTAMLIHLLDQRHLIHLDDPVCEYIPEFGSHHKQWITIRHLLTHRAGIPNVPPQALDLDHLGDRDTVVRIMCEAEPTSRAGRQLAYHAISGGFVLGEVVHRVTGNDIRALLDQEIRRPLGFRWLSYGVPRREAKSVALNYFTGLVPVWPLSAVLQRAFGLDFPAIAAVANDTRFLTGIIPSANIIATANELSRFYQLLLNGGELDGVHIFEPRTVRRATSEQSYLEMDFTLGFPFRYGMGFMLGAKLFSLYGPDTEHAYGHLGFTNIVAWADPERQVAAALMTSGKPLVYPELYYAWDIMRQVGRACPKVENSWVPGFVHSRVAPAPSLKLRALPGNDGARRAKVRVLRGGRAQA